MGSLGRDLRWHLTAVWSDLEEFAISKRLPKPLGCHVGQMNGARRGVSRRNGTPVGLSTIGTCRMGGGHCHRGAALARAKLSQLWKELPYPLWLHLLETLPHGFILPKASPHPFRDPDFPSSRWVSLRVASHAEVQGISDSLFFPKAQPSSGPEVSNVRRKKSYFLFS